jgi:hypothetical protein
VQGPRRALSRELVALWSDDYEPAMLLLKRAFPAGLLRFLRGRRPAPPALLPPTPAMPPQGREVHKQSSGERIIWSLLDTSYLSVGRVPNRVLRVAGNVVCLRAVCLSMMLITVVGSSRVVRIITMV